jgi:cation diffusion facilitator CzcD-associated flavoprotein CzcO
VNQTRPLRFVVIGAGLSGVMSAIKLREAGHRDVTIYEKAASLGGTWRDNTYPGVACDVPSHLYSYSFALNPDWSRQYSSGAEILAYVEAVARRHEVLPQIRFGEEVMRCEFRDGRWHIGTSTGRSDVADVVIAATGLTQHPRMPEIAGVSNFEGASFHSARWDHSIPLEGKRVGVIGTGSSATQIVCALVPRVGKLMLFQRTPQWIMPQENKVFTDADRAKFRDRPQVMQSMRASLERRFRQDFSDAVIDKTSRCLQVMQEMCIANLEAQVTDPGLREKLRPNYRAGCKRLIISSDFYRAIQAPNAALVTESIERIEPRGVRTSDGVLHELDVLVFATGFRVDRFMRPTHIVGRDGLELDTLWAQRPGSYLTIAIPGFPNLFMLNGPNSPFGNFPLIEVAEVQMAYILQLVEQLRRGDCRELSPTPRAALDFETEREAATRDTVWVSGCSSWYLDDRGIPAAWPWTIARFREQLAKPDLTAYERVG